MGRPGGIIGVIVLIWLVIGVIAAYQRDYFKSGATNCASAGAIALTVVAGWSAELLRCQSKGHGLQFAQAQ